MSGRIIRSPGDRSPLRVIVVAGIVTAVLLPLLPLLLQSISRSWFYPDLLPRELDSRAWSYLLSGSAGVLRATVTSLGIAAVVTLLCLLLGVPAGRGLAAAAPGIRRRLELLFLAPLIVPSLAVALGLHVVFIRLGFADTVIGVILSHMLPALPYMVLVMASTFLSVESEMELQARSLGAGPVRAFLTVGVPAAMPGIVTGSLFVFLISWSQYALTLLIGGGRVQTLPMLLFAFIAAGDMSVASALAVVFLIPALLILLFSSRFVSGRSVALGGLGGR